MRVGLFRPVAPEVISGGYTIEHHIFERLLECAPTSKHEFVVFEDLDGDKATGKPPNLKETPRKRPFSAKQLYVKLRTISRTANPVPRPVSPHHVWLISAELASFIESLVYVARLFSTSTRPVLRSCKAFANDIELAWGEPYTLQDHRKQRVSPRAESKFRSTKSAPGGGTPVKNHPQESNGGFKPAINAANRRTRGAANARIAALGNASS
jgi:hypothetical protein